MISPGRLCTALWLKLQNVLARKAASCEKSAVIAALPKNMSCKSLGAAKAAAGLHVKLLWSYNTSPATDRAADFC